MSGNKSAGIVIQERDMTLFRELPVMRVIDCNLTKKVGDFRATRRANARLLKLWKAGFLRRFYQGTQAGGKKAFYTLSPKAARRIGVPANGFRHTQDEIITPNAFVAHQMAVNEVYCAVKYGQFSAQGAQFVRWIQFSRPLTPAIPLVPDGYFEITTPGSTLAAFLEIDLGGEREPVWQKKTRNYLGYATSGKFEEQFGQSRFRVLVIGNSESRARTLRKFVRKLTDKIFWFSNQEAIRREGLWGPVWLRPSDDTLRPFL
jgi:Replication-relaxation